MQLYPLSAPLIDWARFQNVSQEVYGRRNTEIADQRNLQLGDPATFVSIANLNNKISTGLSKAHRHVSMTFIFEAAQSEINILHNETTLTVTVGPRSPEETFVGFASGTITDFVETVVHLCHSDQPLANRKLGTMFYFYFEQTGFRELWYGYHRKKNPAGDIVLKARS